MSLHSAIARHEGVITRRDALKYLSESALHRRLRTEWRILLPGVYLASREEPTRRQRLWAALLYGGPDALLSDATALREHGLRYLPTDETVYLLLPANERRANRDGVVVRRTHRLPPPALVRELRVVPLERAVAEFVARVGDDRAAMAAAAEAVQRRLVPLDALLVELDHITGRGTGSARRIKAALMNGARSAPESDFLDICCRSAVLPAPLLNPLLELPSGARVSPDALFVEAGLVHETNGREPHAAEDRFEDMQARHGAMTAAGLTVLHSTPRQLRLEAPRVLRQVEDCFRRSAGRGLPQGVKLIRPNAA
jgi:hypothetical protein